MEGETTYLAGLLARCAGDPRTDNPFPAGTADWMEWNAGWEAGRAR